MKKFIILIIILSLLLSYKAENRNHIQDTSSSFFNIIKAHYPKAETTLRLMTYNLLSHEIGFDGISSEKRKTDTVALINSLKPDILALQEMSYDFYSLLKNETALTYTAPLTYRLSRTMTTLMYNPKNLTLLVSGTVAYHYSTNPRLRCYTWGLFEDKTTSSIFLAVNTHLNLYEQATAYPMLQATELIDFCRQAEEKYGCPVFILGDFNSPQGNNETHSAVYDYISIFYNNALTWAETKSQGSDKGIYSPTNDYIFCSGNEKIVSFNLLSQPQLNTLSDHYPIFVDVNIHLESAQE